MVDHELDVRPLPKPDKHPAIFQAYAAVPAGESLVLVSDHGPRDLREEFEVDHPGCYTWQYHAQAAAGTHPDDGPADTSR